MESVSKKKTLIGTVTSNKMDKSCVVTISRKFKHARYGKFITRSRSFMAHDEANQVQVGDVVEIIETRPLSKCKTWRVTKVVKKNELPL
ncbi:MAG: 30S ribosomal protein S17 [Deltaproteobacteria bacterium RIFOXYA12_FULL_61_11]|nr:MAG: 30S ribosomal protein S17 [Deltaproteobacteria bacterium RIFOXYA12_FULL_61_11]